MQLDRFALSTRKENLKNLFKAYNRHIYSDSSKNFLKKCYIKALQKLEKKRKRKTTCIKRLLSIAACFRMNFVETVSFD